MIAACPRKINGIAGASRGKGPAVPVDPILVPLNRILVPVNRILVPFNRDPVPVNKILVPVNKDPVPLNRGGCSGEHECCSR
jgi:hypothetical protein